MAEQLPFDADSGLHQPRRLEMTVNLVGLCGGAARGRSEFVERRSDRKRGVVHVRPFLSVSDLVDSVVLVSSQNVGDRKPVIKDPPPSSNNGLAATVAFLSWSPSESDARRPIAFVVDVGLRLPAQAQAQGEVRAYTPVILNKRAKVQLRNTDVWLARGCRKFRWPVSQPRRYLLARVAPIQELYRRQVLLDRTDCL